MAITKEERNARKRERETAARRDKGIGPRAPAMTAEEKRVAWAVASKKFRASQKAEKCASENTGAISMTVSSGVDAMGIPVTKSQHDAIKAAVAELALLSTDAIAGFTQAVRKLRVAREGATQTVEKSGAIAPPANRRSEAAMKREAAKFPKYRDARLEREAEKAAKEHQSWRDRNANLLAGQKRLAALVAEGKKLNTPFGAALPDPPSSIPVEHEGQPWTEAEEAEFMAELHTAQVEQDATLAAEVRREQELKAMVKRGELSQADIEFFGLNRRPQD